MTYLLTMFLFILCFTLMAVGVIFAKRSLKKGCSLGPDCTCKAERKPADECEHFSKKENQL